MWIFTRRMCLVIVDLVKLANKIDIDDETVLVGTRLKCVSDLTCVFDDVSRLLSRLRVGLTKLRLVYTQFDSILLKCLVNTGIVYFLL